MLEKFDPGSERNKNSPIAVFKLHFTVDTALYLDIFLT